MRRRLDALMHRRIDVSRRTWRACEDDFGFDYAVTSEAVELILGHGFKLN